MFEDHAVTASRLYRCLVEGVCNDCPYQRIKDDDCKGLLYNDVCSLIQWGEQICTSMPHIMTEKEFNTIFAEIRKINDRISNIVTHTGDNYAAVLDVPFMMKGETK